MGNNASSLQSQVYAAVHKNNVAKFQELTSNFGPLANLASTDPLQRAKVLEQRDVKNRSLLILAAAKNYYQLVQLLLPLGVDIHYVNTNPQCLGSALHEAAARGHEGVVELLLHAGASPFVANSQGHTALDEAVLANHCGIVRRIEQHAAFKGDIECKVKTMGGLTSKYKTRWAVVMPWYPMPKPTEPTATAATSTSSSGPPGLHTPGAKRCMWMYKDRTSATPRCRVWLDGASTVRTGPSGIDGMVRLHTSHGEPVGDAATKFDRGYCIFLRPANLTGAAADTYRALLDLIDSPPSHTLPGSAQLRPTNSRTGGIGALASSPGSFQLPPAASIPLPALSAANSGVSVTIMPGGGHYPSTPSPLPSMYPHAGLPPPPHISGHNSSPYPTIPLYGGMHAPPMSAYPPPQPVLQQRPSLTAMPVTLPPSVTLQQQQQQQRPSSHHGGPYLPTGGSVGPERASPAMQQQQHRHTSSDPSYVAALAASVAAQQAGGPPEVFVDNLHALPGESDMEFAARLASAIAATSGKDQVQIYPGASTSSNNTSAGGGGGGTASAGGTTWSSSSPSTSSHPTGGGASTSSGGMSAASGHHGAASGGGRTTSAGSTKMGGSGETEPSAPLVPGAAGALLSQSGSQRRHRVTADGVFGGGEGDGDVELCVICLSGPKEVGFLHGDSVHRCVCRGCSSALPMGSPCPLCRQPVERILGVY